jgi:hypothetical protein
LPCDGATDHDYGDDAAGIRRSSDENAATRRRVMAMVLRNERACILQIDRDKLEAHR